MEPINQSIEVFNAVLGPIHSLLGVLQWIIGGVFGIYLGILIFNWYKNRQLLRQIGDMQSDIKEIKRQVTELSKRHKKNK